MGQGSTNVRYFIGNLTQLYICGNPCGTFLFRTKPIFALYACADKFALMSTTFLVDDTFHSRSYFSFWQKANMSYTVRVNTAVSANSFLAWFKKYQLFLNYTCAFISSFNCLYETEEKSSYIDITVYSDICLCGTEGVMP